MNQPVHMRVLTLAMDQGRLLPESDSIVGSPPNFDQPGEYLRLFKLPELE